jgi:monothiol glutaredoxin
VSSPDIQISEAAVRALRDAGAGGSEGDVHLEISPAYDHDLFLGPPAPGEIEVVRHGLSIWMSPETASRAAGVTIEWAEQAGGAGFRIENPGAPARVRGLSPAELQAMIAKGEPFELLDVRSPREIALGAIAGSRPLDQETMERLGDADRDTPIVLYCHHGMRSRAAAEQLVRQGFRRVWNLLGGIDAWSVAIDPSVRRY